MPAATGGEARRADGRVVAVVGPTAAGKSGLGVALALALGGEVVNADSMQLYRGMDIGTSKLAPDERGGVPHHLLDVWPVTRTADVASYQHDARAVLDALLRRGRVPVLVGGSGLYVRAALDRLEFPGTDPVVRARLEAELETLGAAALHARLAALAPEAAAGILASNGRRIVRALEVVTLTGGFRAELPPHQAVYDVTFLGLDAPVAELDGRVAGRVDRMWAQGLLHEVAGLVDRGLQEGRTASRALGYAQALDHLDGRTSARQARDATVAATRRFVRRQRSWFRRDPRIHWLPEPDLRAALAVVPSG